MDEGSPRQEMDFSTCFVLGWRTGKGDLREHCADLPCRIEHHHPSVMMLPVMSILR